MLRVWARALEQTGEVGRGNGAEKGGRGDGTGVAVVEKEANRLDLTTRLTD